MTHTFTKTSLKKSFRGFTLIELLVVIAIIGLLSTIIAAPIQNARKKARDAKKIAEIKSVQLALDQYAEANAGQYPPYLRSLVPTFMPILPSFGISSSTSVADKDKFGYAPYKAAGTGVSVAGIYFAYHLGAHLETFSQGLDNDRDCLGADASAGYTAPLTAPAASSTCAFYPSPLADVSSFYDIASANYQLGMMTSVTAITAPVLVINAGTVADFNGSDGDTTKCNATTDCVFDVTGQQ
jgi:prepilin-type N-terminal cleavage/methylation domain-containing protein